MRYIVTVLISSRLGVIQHDCKTYLRGVVQFDYSSRCWSETIAAKPMEGQQPPPGQDLGQVLSRIQDIVSTQLNAFKREIRDDQEKALNGVVKKLKASDKLVFKKKSNEMSFKSLQAVESSLHDAMASLENRKLEKVQESLEEGKRLISVRTKEILLADKHGWEFVNEYQREDLTDDSEYEKRMRRALKTVSQERSNKRRSRGRGLKGRSRAREDGVSRNSVPYIASQFAATVPVVNPSYFSSCMCYYCGKYGHYWRNCSARNISGGFHNTQSGMFRQLTPVQPSGSASLATCSEPRR